MRDEIIQIKAVKKVIPTFDNPFSRSASCIVCNGITYYKVIDGKDIEITKAEYNELLEVINKRNTDQCITHIQS